MLVLHAVNARQRAREVPLPARVSGRGVFEREQSTIAALDVAESDLAVGERSHHLVARCRIVLEDAQPQLARRPEVALEHRHPGGGRVERRRLRRSIPEALDAWTKPGGDAPKAVALGLGALRPLRPNQSRQIE